MERHLHIFPVEIVFGIGFCAWIVPGSRKLIPHVLTILKIIKETLQDNKLIYVVPIANLRSTEYTYVISKETRRHDEFRSSWRRRRRIRGEANGSIDAVYIDIVVSFRESFDVFDALYGLVARLLFLKTARAMKVTMELVRYYSVAPCVVY